MIGNETKKIICELYSNGKNPREISKFFLIGESTVYQILRSCGVEPKYKRKSEAGKKGANVKREIKTRDQLSELTCGDNSRFIISSNGYRIEFDDFCVSSAIGAIRDIQDAITDLFFVKD